MIRTRCVLLAALCWPFIFCGPAPADEPRWSEAAYGVSLKPPPGSLRLESRETAWADPRGFTIGFEIITSDVPVTLEDVAANTVVQMGFANASPRLIDADGQTLTRKPRQERIAERPGIRMWFRVEPQDEAQPAWHYGQAIVMLEPYAAAVLNVRATAEAADAGRQAFDRVLESLHVPLAVELEAARSERVAAGDNWLQTVTPDDLRAALPVDRRYRLVFGDRDVGYLQVGHTADPAVLGRLGHEPPGTLVRVRRRQMLGGRAMDTLTTLFVADDGRRETWDTKSTVRPEGANAATPGLPRRGGPEPLTWAETGVRGDQRLGNAADARTVNTLTVVHESPPDTADARRIEAHERFAGRSRGGELRGRVRTNQWVAPDRAYLSQVHVLALPVLLPNEAATYHFSAYHPPTGRPGLRTVEVIPQPDGSRVVLDRPTSRLTAVRTTLDADGNLVEQLLPNGTRILPATPEELATIWGTPGN
ncbi:MAG: hypothetical protein AAF710_06030 [Planctomycetota bacterium]